MSIHLRSVLLRQPELRKTLLLLCCVFLFALPARPMAAHDSSIDEPYTGQFTVGANTSQAPTYSIGDFMTIGSPITTPTVPAVQAPTSASGTSSPSTITAAPVVQSPTYAIGDFITIGSPSPVVSTPTSTPAAVQSPVFLIASPYTGSATIVTLAESTKGAVIRYCMDTTNTCTPSKLYVGGVPFASSGYVRAVGVLNGLATSAVSSWQGTLTAAQITTSSCPTGTQYQTYAGCKISATGGIPPYTYGWSTTSGDGLVEGLHLAPLTGEITGTVYGQGTYSIPITVTDATRSTVTKLITLPVRADNTTGGCSLFPADSIWHMNVSKLPIDTSVAAPIPSVYANSSLHIVFGSELNDGGIPFLRVPYSQKNVPVKTTVYQSYYTSGPFPSYAPVESTQNSGADGDRHVLILQTAGGGHNCRLWEMWQGAPTSNGWTDSSNAYWDLGTYDMLPQDNGSTDAAGLPILPLLWNYDEVAGSCGPGAECGVVKHPARLTLNHTLNYHVWPATSQSGLAACAGGYEDYNHLISQSNPPTSCGTSSPMGEIYRLKSGTAAPTACVGHPQAQVLITAMRNYGLIVADNGVTGGIVATADSRWNDTDLACLTNLKLSDFEPVDVSGKMIGLNSSQVRP